MPTVIPVNVMAFTLRACLALLLVCSSNAFSTFSAGLAMTELNATEQTLLDHTATNASVGSSLNYFWITGDECVGSALVRMYVDGENSASLTFEPAKATGMGYALPAQNATPWSTPWIGSLGRNSFVFTFPVPFQTRLVVTFQAGSSGGCKVWIQVRGTEGTELSGVIRGITMPPTARLQLQRREGVTYQPLDYMTVADVANSSGAFLFSTMWWDTASPNTIEGCWRAFTPRTAPWPGLQLSTGWEDYYASSWGFINGAFTAALSGITHWTSPGNLATSAYRFHDTDPLFFVDGLLLVQRNGETIDGAGVKCRLQTGGQPFGSPGVTNFSSYAWYYTW